MRKSKVWSGTKRVAKLAMGASCGFATLAAVGVAMSGGGLPVAAVAAALGTSSVTLINSAFESDGGEK